MILLANISTSLEIANGNQVQLKNLENFQVCQWIILRDWVKGWCGVIAQFGSLI